MNLESLNWGDLSPEIFLKEYWQKKPLLIKQAFSNFEDTISADELAGLAMEAEIESRIISVDNNDELLVAIKETIGNSNFIKLVELISVKTTEQWILQSFQKWKLEAPTREDEYAKDQDRRDIVKKREKFLKDRKTDTSDAWHRFDKEGTIVKNKTAYSLRDFEEVAEIFHKFKAIKNGPKLKRSGWDGFSYNFYYSDKKGAWEGGSEGHSESMSLVEFVSIAKNK